MIKVLNLYAGVGGNRKLWKDVEVTAVEKNPDIARIYKSNFPEDEVIIGDSREYLTNNFQKFDFIWSSPPCQRNSKLCLCNRRTVPKLPDLRLYEEYIFLKHFFKGKFVIENVDPYYDEIIPAQKSSRHLFWSNFIIEKFDIKFPGNLSHARKEDLQNWLGIYFDENVYYGNNHDPAQIYRNCVHPKLGEHIFNCAFKTKQKTLLTIG